MASRMLGAHGWDYGAQYFTARSKRFQYMVAQWQKAELVSVWFEHLPKELRPGTHPRYKGYRGLRSLPESLAQGLDIDLQTRVTGLNFKEGIWQLTTNNARHLTGKALLMTPPVPQTLELLTRLRLPVSPELLNLLDASHYRPCLTLLLRLAEPTGWSPPGIRCGKVDSPLAWLADNQVKGMASSPCLTLQSSAEFAEHYLDAPDEWTEQRLLAALKDEFGIEPVESHFHRWRYALCDQPLEGGFAHDPKSALWVAGDGFQTPFIEGAALSGLAASTDIAGALQPPSGVQ